MKNKKYLFRGYSKLLKKWIYGGIAYVEKDVFICGTGANPRELTFTLVDPKSVGMKLGEGVYEGDIIAYGKKRFTLKFDMGIEDVDFWEIGPGIRRNFSWSNRFNLSMLEVTGNSYERHKGYLVCNPPKE